MPQKKNPGVFEVARGKACRVLGEAHGVQMGLAKAFYADVLDLRLVNAPSYHALQETAATMEFLATVIRTLQVG